MDTHGNQIIFFSIKKISPINICICLFTFFLSCNLKKENKEELKIEVGKNLFFDTHLSLNNTKSCASCHAPEYAFTDGYRTSVTALGENVKHNSPTLLNVSKLHFYDWSNPSITTLEQQIQRPLFNHQPIELGLDKHIDSFRNYLKKSPDYYKKFIAIYNNDSFSTTQIIDCLISFEKQLNSKNSLYDKYRLGNKNALNQQQIKGMELFFSVKMECSKCHGGEYFTNATLSKNIDSVYFNIGNKKNDTILYKTPTLRNCSITAPYLHDGSVSNLADAIKSHRSIKINDTEISSLVQFLETLSDSVYTK